MKRAERELLVSNLRVLLEVQGTVTPWEVLEAWLMKAPREVLIALEYRVRQARADAFDDGQRRG